MSYGIKKDKINKSRFCPLWWELLFPNLVYQSVDYKCNNCVCSMLVLRLVLCLFDIQYSEMCVLGKIIFELF